MNYMKISHYDTANGEGMRTVLWVSGCTHKCKECHNPQTWDFNAGKEFDNAAMDEILDSLDNEYISGITISGGDPMNPNNIQDVFWVVYFVKEKYPDKTIWIYTGYSWDEIKDNHVLLDVDVVVDGEYISDERDITLPWCGSKNQRVIDVQKSLQQGEIILYKGAEGYE